MLNFNINPTKNLEVLANPRIYILTENNVKGPNAISPGLLKMLCFFNKKYIYTYTFMYSVFILFLLYIMFAVLIY
jgi:hypothetical protein